MTYVLKTKIQLKNPEKYSRFEKKTKIKVLAKQTPYQLNLQFNDSFRNYAPS